jgi:hypothetical protein
MMKKVFSESNNRCVFSRRFSQFLGHNKTFDKTYPDLCKADATTEHVVPKSVIDSSAS